MKDIKKIPIDKIKVAKVDMDTYDKSESYIHIFKCTKRECRLEFAVFSWQEDWYEKNKPFCPECGGKESINLSTKFVKRKIWEIVGGPNLGQEKSGKSKKIANIKEENV